MNLPALLSKCIHQYVTGCYTTWLQFCLRDSHVMFNPIFHKRGHSIYYYMMYYLVLFLLFPVVVVSYIIASSH